MRWTREEIVIAIRLWAGVYGHGSPPRHGDWEAGGPWWPSNGTVKRTFGSWDKAIKASGFAPRGRGRPTKLRSLV